MYPQMTQISQIEAHLRNLRNLWMKIQVIREAQWSMQPYPPNAPMHGPTTIRETGAVQKVDKQNRKDPKHAGFSLRFTE